MSFAAKKGFRSRLTILINSQITIFCNALCHLVAADEEALTVIAVIWLASARRGGSPYRLRVESRWRDVRAIPPYS